MLEKVRQFDPTVTAENAALKLGDMRIHDTWKAHEAGTKIPAGRDRGVFLLEAWNQKWKDHPELFLFSNDTLYAVLREADPTWHHVEASGKICGYYCLWPPVAKR